MIGVVTSDKPADELVVPEAVDPVLTADCKDDIFVEVAKSALDVVDEQPETKWVLGMNVFLWSFFS